MSSKGLDAVMENENVDSSLEIDVEVEVEIDVEVEIGVEDVLDQIRELGFSRD